MTKEAEAIIEPLAAKVFALRAQKKALENDLSAFEKKLRETIGKFGFTVGTAGSYHCELQKVAGNKIVDADKLRADGLFEKYSKVTAGYEKLLVKKV